MHPIAEKFFALDSEGKKNVHISMAKLALESWNKHLAAGNIPLEYQETVTGTHQKVDVSLPADAIKAVISNNASDVSERYREPICAMQDDDWQLNDDAAYAYYSINNTYKKYLEGKEIDDWLIVNQALSSLGEGADILLSLEESLSFITNNKQDDLPNKLLKFVRRIVNKTIRKKRESTDSSINKNTQVLINLNCCSNPKLKESLTDLGHADSFDFVLRECGNCNSYWLNVFCVATTVSEYESISREEALKMLAAKPGPERKHVMKNWAYENL